jgi:hypothetical protein
MIFNISINKKYIMMSLSSNCCLKRISQQVKAVGYMEVSDTRVREACLANNFDVIAATDKLIREEQLKISLEDLCVQMGQNPNKKLILCSCNRFKFQTIQVKRYIRKLLKARENVQMKCVESNIEISDTELDDRVIYAFGNELVAFNNIQQDH